MTTRNFFMQYQSNQRHDRFPVLRVQSTKQSRRIARDVQSVLVTLVSRSLISGTIAHLAKLIEALSIKNAHNAAGFSTVEGLLPVTRQS